ncbi:MAG: hypothetical protein IPK53_03805 [bacterium]|nr:hypothetical protein [bacterium]
MSKTARRSLSFSTKQLAKRAKNYAAGRANRHVCVRPTFKGVRLGYGKPRLDKRFWRGYRRVALALVWFSTEGIQALMDFWQVTGPLLDGVIAQLLNFVKIIMQVVTGDWDGAWQSIKDGFALGWENHQENA